MTHTEDTDGRGVDAVRAMLADDPRPGLVADRLTRAGYVDAEEVAHVAAVVGAMTGAEAWHARNVAAACIAAVDHYRETDR